MAAWWLLGLQMFTSKFNLKQQRNIPLVHSVYLFNVIYSKYISYCQNRGLPHHLHLVGEVNKTSVIRRVNYPDMLPPPQRFRRLRRRCKALIQASRLETRAVHLCDFHGQKKKLSTGQTWQGKVACVHQREARLAPGNRFAGAWSLNPFLNTLASFPNLCASKHRAVIFFTCSIQ